MDEESKSQGPNSHNPPLWYCRHGGLTIVPMPGFENLAIELAKIIEDKDSRPTQVDIAIPKFGLRSSGEPFVQLGKTHIGNHDCVVITSGPGTYEMLGQTLLTLGYLAGRRAGRITLLSTYFPLGRSDRDEGDLELALPPFIVHMMNAATNGKLSRIISFDLHAAQVVMAGGSIGMITEVTLAKRVLTHVIKDVLDQGIKKIVIHFSDDGATKRYEESVSEAEQDLQISLPITCGTKRRKNSTTSRHGTLYGDIDALNGSLVIALDDEAATMGTLIHTAEAIKAKYPILGFYSAVIHGVFCGQAVELLERENCPIDRTYSTDTIPFHNRPHLQPLISRGKLEVISSAKDLANIIFYHHWDLGIRNIR